MSETSPKANPVLFRPRPRPVASLAEKVVVILGASSGVGRGAALAFAEEGARVVIAARGGEALQDVETACEDAGAEAFSVIADASDAAQVKAMAEAAVARFGRIDVWINCVGSGAVGAFDETPIEAHEQILRTNLLGYIHGAHAVVPIFKRQGEGVLINMNSAGGFVPAPYAVAYSASKFGLRGYSEALRGELAPYPGIHVCDVFPTFLDTPGLSHSANYVSRRLRPFPPVKDPQAVADTLVSLARRPRKTAMVGVAVLAGRLGHALAPALSAWGMGRFAELYFRLAEPVERTDGNLFRPSPRSTAAVHGGLRRPQMRQAALAGGVAVVAFAAVSALLGGRRSRA